MKKYIIIFSFFVILPNCLANMPSRSGVSPKSLYGYWSLEGVTWLNITSDSIYFVDEDGEPSIKYSVNNDTIVFYFDELIIKSKFNIVQDTLFMKNEGGTTKYIRVENKRKQQKNETNRSIFFVDR